MLELDYPSPPLPMLDGTPPKTLEPPAYELLDTEPKAADGLVMPA